MKTQSTEPNGQKKEAPKQELPIAEEVIQSTPLLIDPREDADDLDDEPLTSFQQITNGDFKRLMGCGG